MQHTVFADFVDALKRLVLRRDVQLVRQAVSEGRRAYVLVNNRSEGNAPLTVQALTQMLSKNKGPAPFGVEPYAQKSAVS